MTRFLRQNKKKKNINKKKWEATDREARIVSYENLFNDLVSNGKSIEEALSIVENVQRQEENKLEYEAELAQEAKKEGNKEKENTVSNKKFIEIRIYIGLKDLLKVVPNFEDMTPTQQQDVLWQIGFDTKSNNFWREEMQYINKEGKRDYGVVLYSQERCDRGWVELRDERGARYASEEAQDAYRMKRDNTWRKTILELVG